MNVITFVSSSVFTCNTLHCTIMYIWFKLHKTYVGITKGIQNSNPYLHTENEMTPSKYGSDHSNPVTQWGFRNIV